MIINKKIYIPMAISCTHSDYIDAAFVQNVNKVRYWSRRASQARLDQWRSLLTFCTEAQRQTRADNRDSARHAWTNHALYTYIFAKYNLT